MALLLEGRRIAPAPLKAGGPVLQAAEARNQERTWRQRAEAAEAALEQAKQDMADIKADMMRQHAMLQVGEGEIP